MSHVIDLTGKVAFVTGSTRGIGRAIAEALHAAGATVAVVGRSREQAEAVAAELGERARGFGCDLTQPDTVRAALAECEAALGPVDVLVNNAGLTRDNLLIRLSEQEWDEVLAANLKGAFVATQAVLKGMMKRRAGRIINITSVVGVTGNKGQANYAASKAGLIGFTKSAARELARYNIIVNCVAPGASTPMTETIRTDERFKQRTLDRIPLGRWAEPEEIAPVWVFLASEGASYVTGQLIGADGGMSIH